jgi:hypothetical protein
MMQIGDRVGPYEVIAKLGEGGRAAEAPMVTLLVNWVD